MSKTPASITRYRPERPIYINEQNTGAKNKIESIYYIEQLRTAGWLCCYSEIVRPLHLSFDNENEFQEFKKSCDKLKIKLKSPVIKSDDDIVPLDNTIIPPEPVSSYEDPLGIMHIE